MPIPPPPPDNSGGFMTLSYQNGTDVHRQRLHVLPFSLTQFVAGAGATANGADSGNHDYAYQPFRSGGPESGIVDTFAAYATKWSAIYSASWTLTLLNLFQNVNNVLTEVPLLPVTAAVIGASGGPTVAGPARAGELILNFKTSGGNRARLVYLANGLIDPTQFTPTLYTPTSGPSTPLQLMVGYVSGSATAIVAHDGTKLSANARVTGTTNKRLRRHYGYA